MVTANAEMGIHSHIEALSQKEKEKKRKKRKINFGLENLVDIHKLKRFKMETLKWRFKMELSQKVSAFMKKHKMHWWHSHL